MEKGSSVESSELVDWACRLPLPRDRSTQSAALERVSSWPIAISLRTGVLV